METAISLQQIPVTQVLKPSPKAIRKQVNHSLQPGSIEKTLIWMLIKLRIFYLACIILKHPRKVWATFKIMINLRNTVWAGDLKKIYKVDGKYYFNQYTPGWPSKAYDSLIKGELLRRASPLTVTEKLSFVFLAIT